MSLVKLCEGVIDKPVTVHVTVNPETTENEKKAAEKQIDWYNGKYVGQTDKGYIVSFSSMTDAKLFRDKINKFHRDIKTMFADIDA